MSILFYHISSSYFNCTFYQYSELSFQNFLTVRKLQNCSSVILFLLCRLRNNRFTFLQNVMAGGIRGQCPSVTANKWENGTSVYNFPMLAICKYWEMYIFSPCLLIMLTYGFSVSSNVSSCDFHAIIFSISFSKT